MQRELTKGSVLKSIVYFSIPYLLSYFLQTLYGLADLYITGQYNGSDIISAVSIGSQVMHMITVIIVGLAMGSTVMIGRAVGENNQKQASKAIGNTIILFMAVSLLFTGVLLLITDQVVSVMSTPVEAVKETKLYLMICFAGIPCITAYNMISSVFRGMGDSKSPMYFIAVACIVNVGLDYFLIGVLGLQAVGAALGTVMSQTISVIFALCYLRVKKFKIAFTKQDFVPDKEMLMNILKIGVPVAFQDGFIQVSFLIITIIANKRGVDVAAAVGIVEKIIGVLFLIPSSMLSSISAIGAQNIGAGLHDRARKILKYGIMISVSFGVFFLVLFQFISSLVLSLFTDKEIVVILGTQYLKAYVIDCAFAAVHFCFSGFFCAYGLSMISFIHNVVSILVVRVPGAYLAAKLFPDTLYPMGLAAPLGSLVSAFICVGYYIWFRKKKFYEPNLKH